MFKFVSGLAIGWTAARVLPPPPPGEKPWRVPTIEEIRLLGLAASRALDKAKAWLENDDDQLADSTDQRADSTRFS